MVFKHLDVLGRNSTKEINLLLQRISLSMASIQHFLESSKIGITYHYFPYINIGPQKKYDIDIAALLMRCLN